MPSKVAIMNLALTYLGKPRIQSETQTGPEAEALNAVYDFVLDALLSEHPWNFATRYLSLAVTADTYTAWDYSYQYPTGCLRALTLVPQALAGTIVYPDGTIKFATTTEPTIVTNPPFEVAASNDGTGRRICTDESPAELRYIGQVTDCNLFSPTFSMAFGLRLAMTACGLLGGDLQKLDVLTKLYGMQLEKALTTDAREGNLPLVTATPSLEAMK